MSNYVLVCHGDPLEFPSFDLAKDQEVQYRGNFGAVLGYGTALAVWKALEKDPTISDEELAMGIDNYQPSEALEGPGSFRPDILLSGDDKLFLFLVNMESKNYIQLGGDWQMKLSQLIAALGKGGSFWLNLLCCTQVPDSGIQAPDGAHLVSSFEKIL